MRTKSGVIISNIGIGTQGISAANMESEVASLLCALRLGINFFDVLRLTDDGGALHVVAEATNYYHREDIFINAHLSAFGSLEDMEHEIDLYLRALNTDYLDCITLNCATMQSSQFVDCVKYVNTLRATNKFYHIGYSNLTAEQFALVKNNVEYYEGLYNLEDKESEDNGILTACIESGIGFYAYSPLKKGEIVEHGHQLLQVLAKRHGKTQNQILLNWMLKHKKIGVIIKSSNAQHIQENVAAQAFEMTLEDYKLLDKFRYEKTAN